METCKPLSLAIALMIGSLSQTHTAKAQDATEKTKETNRKAGVQQPGKLKTVKVEATEIINGPAEGYTAKRNATGTKTDSLLIQAPISVQVISREVMDDQQVLAIKKPPGAVGFYIKSQGMFQFVLAMLKALVPSTPAPHQMELNLIHKHHTNMSWNQVGINIRNRHHPCYIPVN